jgi:catechol 2,3-dioxygenase-like lactoylglutathione lyase family enzyme
MPDGPFEARGLNHLALVCSDMARTVDFYDGLLGFKLFKTIELPGGGQHFFFDIGGGASLAFFWFKDAPPAAPGIASQDPKGFASAIGSMNHVAIDVPLEKIDEYHEKLKALGIKNHVINHDDSERGASLEVHDGTWIRSIYFWDPDGIRLEFAAYARSFDEGDVQHAPVDATGRPREAATA